MKRKRPPVVLIAATVWWPLSARLAMALARAGCTVRAICPTGHPIRCVAGIDKIYPYSGMDSMKALEDSVRDSHADVIVPCDDGVVWQLHALHRLRPDLAPLIEDSLGPSRMYATLRSRGEFLQTSSALGVRIPETRIVASERDLDAWWSTQFPSAVLKLDGTWGGNGVEVVHSRQQAVEVFRRMTRPRSASLHWKRFLVNRDPLALWNWRQNEKPVVTIQRFIAGNPANTMFLASRGEVLSTVTVEVLCAQGERGAATVVRLVHNREIAFAAKTIASHFELSGFYGLDFILEQSTGAAYLLEMNPRATQLGHLPLSGQGDLAGALYAHLSGDAAPRSPTPIEGDTIAFFPQTFAWSPKSAYLRTAYHDVPWEEPALVRELLLESWPDRQRAARIYHHFRSPARIESVEFPNNLVPAGGSPKLG